MWPKIKKYFFSNRLWSGFLIFFLGRMFLISMLLYIRKEALILNIKKERKKFIRISPMMGERKQVVQGVPREQHQQIAAIHAVHDLHVKELHDRIFEIYSKVLNT